MYLPSNCLSARHRTSDRQRALVSHTQREIHMSYNSRQSTVNGTVDMHRILYSSIYWFYIWHNLLLHRYMMYNYNIRYATFMGCDHIGHKPYRPQQDDIGHSKKPYRPHGKSISATTISAKTISATKYTASLFGIIVSILLCFVYRPSPYREFERETAH